MIEIDGAQGEGGGQILRSSLSLAICTQQAFHIAEIRANRDPPGLKRQHLTAVRAAAEICDARVEGAELGSRAFTFRPGPVRAGEYSFAIGTAGSSTLVLQTVLPPLLRAEGPSHVRITGGTHNRGSPPFDFLERAFLRQLRVLGGDVDLTLATHGFYPRGGGEIRARILPVMATRALDLTTRGTFVRGFAEAYIAGLPGQIAQRELEVVGRHLGWGRELLHLRALPNDRGPGNAVTVTLEYEHVTEVFTGFGERGVRAEEVALAAAREAAAYLAASAPVGEHLADQLLLPMALGAGGRFLATVATEHLRTNARVVERFTGRRVRFDPLPGGTLVEMGSDPIS
jgi:RNA 3'-terminal phosphate cyclase (ATP)